jgi:hypothetical protein
MKVSLMRRDAMTPRALRAKTFVAVTAMASLLAGCAPVLKTGSHVERGARFTHYRTWEWAPAQPAPTGDARLDSNPMFVESLRAAVEHQLARQGYVRTALAGPPDLSVRYHVAFSKTFEVTGGAPATGSCSGNCEPEAYAYEQGTLVVDLVDVRTSTLAWRGWSRDNMDGVIDKQNSMDDAIVRIVAAMFEHLPSAP